MLLTGLSGLAQNKACFKAYDAVTGAEIQTICIGQKIKIKNCQVVSPSTIQYYDYDRRDGVPFNNSDTVNTHTFTVPGDYRISFIPVDPNSSVSDSTSRKFTVLPKPRPRFQVLGCAQRNVQVTITDRNYNAFLVNFGDGTTRQLLRGESTSHQYTTGQDYKVTVTARYSQALCEISADTTVRNLPAAAAPGLKEVRLLTLGAGGNVALSFDQARPDYFYIVEKNESNSFVPVDTIKNPTTAVITRTYNQVNTQNQVCWRIRMTDPCGTNLNQVSNAGCSQPLMISVNQTIDLAWPVYRNLQDIQGYQLFRDGVLYKDLPATASSFSDDKVVCGKQYCYQLTGSLHSGIKTYSNSPCIVFTTAQIPPKATLMSTFTPDNRVELSLTVPPSQTIREITFQKSENTGPFFDILKGRDRKITDSKFKLSAPACYQGSYLDSCNQVSPVSNQTCPVYLTVNLNPDNSVGLKWTAFVGFAGLPQYQVEKLDVNGNVMVSQPVNGQTYTDKLTGNGAQRVLYRIKALSPTAEISYSNTESLQLEAKVGIPTAFTPNGDGLNDRFEVKGRFIQVSHMSVYNRWGQIIYEGQQANPGWDGTFNGKPAPVGNYTYSIRGQDENGKGFTKTGIVSLIR